MLATEETSDTTEKRPQLPPLESWADNPRMRHIPSMEWIIWKVDHDVRGRLTKLLAAFKGAPAMEAELRNVCRALDRLGEAARHTRGNGLPHDLSGRIHWSLDHCLTNLRSVDATTFGRRFPYNAFEKSRAEPLYGAFLAVLSAVERVMPHAREADPRFDEHLLEGLVVLANPVDDRMLKPIA